MLKPASLCLIFAQTLLCASCADEATTAVQLTVVFEQSTVAPDQLEVVLLPGEQDSPPPRRVPEQAGEPLPSEVTVLLLVPESWDGQAVQVQVKGLAAGELRAEGAGSCIVREGKVVSLLVTLSAKVPCQDACPLGDSQCVADAVRSCRQDAAGCARWAPPEACPAATPYCSNGRCEAECSDECSAGAKRCSLEGAQSCGEHDSDSCLEWGPALGCGESELCQDGECLPDCGGQPCSCAPGETSACADVGECTSGLRRCIDSAFGPCEWTVGPQAELCDGKDNDCNGQIDDGLAAPACAEQRGVCQGAVQSCPGAAGWAACDASSYMAHAASSGQTYQAAETLCDGQDNDCNGQTDEPAACCQPNCTGRVCGLDPVCGTICGTCATGQSCSEQGQCQFPSCTEEGPLVVDAAGSVGLHASLALDPGGKVHISYYDSTNEDLKVATNAAGAWQTHTIDAAEPVGTYTSLAIDPGGKVHISYYDSTNEDLKYATNTSGAWQTQTVDSAGGVGWETSLAIDAGGKVHISYHDYSNKDLKYATNAAGAWQTQTIDSAGEVGWYTSLAPDPWGKIHISYYDNTNGDLKVATNASSAWQTQAADSAGNVGRYTSLAVDPGGKVHISYHDSTKYNLKYATNASGSWQTQTVDTGSVGWFTSLALDPGGKAHISYYDFTNFDLKVATNASGSWQTQTIDSVGDVGMYNSLALDPGGKVHISYYDNTNYDLKYVALCP